MEEEGKRREEERVEKTSGFVMRPKEEGTTENGCQQEE